MKTRIEDAARTYSFRRPELIEEDAIESFIAGAGFMQDEVEKLQAQNEIMRDALVKIDSSNDDMKYFNSDIHVIIHEAREKVGEV
jgi:hypothetical protein